MIAPKNKGECEAGEALFGGRRPEARTQAEQQRRVGLVVGALNLSNRQTLRDGSALKLVKRSEPKATSALN